VIMKNIAIIPARSGSKGLIDKNIKLLNGKHLLSYTVEAALESNMFDCVYVSTDSQGYAELAIKYGASVPFLRSNELASDTASSWDSAKYTIDKFEQLGEHFDTVALLQPTSPLRTAQDIVNAYSIYKDRNAKVVISVCEMDHPPLWSNLLPENLCMENFILPENNVRRQELPVYYRENGAIFLVDREIVMQDQNIYGAYSFAYVMDKNSSIDIDDNFDFQFAEMIMKDNIKGSIQKSSMKI
jgi:CMP-N,N'-diacetyllegionaminic acid synthase